MDCQNLKNGDVYLKIIGTSKLEILAGRRVKCNKADENIAWLASARLVKKSRTLTIGIRRTCQIKPIYSRLPGIFL